MSIEEIFSLYRKKTKELINSRFSQSLKGSGIKIRAKRGQQVISSRTGPDIEAMRSFAIIIRNFSLDSDPISIRNISEIYEKLPKEDQIRKEFFKIRKALNEFLKSSTNITINRKQLTYSELIDRYLYGEVIHLTKHKEFNEWIKFGPMNVIIYNEIVYALAILANHIVCIDTVNHDLLERDFKPSR